MGSTESDGGPKTCGVDHGLLVGVRVPATMPMMKSLSDDHAELFMVIAQTVTPEVASLDADGRSRMAAIVDEALTERDPATRKQLGTFLGVIRIAPILRYGRPFPALDPGRRTAVLRWFENCPVSRVRTGFWGLKALVFMGYYGQPELWPELGYEPGFDGREGVRHA